jgi:hypothetical protein
MTFEKQENYLSGALLSVGYNVWETQECLPWLCPACCLMHTWVWVCVHTELHVCMCAKPQCKGNKLPIYVNVKIVQVIINTIQCLKQQLKLL